MRPRPTEPAAALTLSLSAASSPTTAVTAARRPRVKTKSAASISASRIWNIFWARAKLCRGRRGFVRGYPRSRQVSPCQFAGPRPLDIARDVLPSQRVDDRFVASSSSSSVSPRNGDNFHREVPGGVEPMCDRCSASSGRDRARSLGCGLSLLSRSGPYFAQNNAPRSCECTSQASSTTRFL